MYITNKYTTTLTTLYTSTTLTTLEEERDKISNDLKEIEYDELFNKIDKLDIAGRNLELFLPLMIVAQEIGVLGDFLEVAGKMAQYKKENEFIESKDVSLYDFVASKGISGKDYTQVKQLTTEFRMFLGDSDDEEQWLNERWLSRALRRLNLIKESRRVASGREITLDYIKAQEQLKIFKEKNDKTE